MGDAIEYHMHGDCRYTVKVYGWTLDKFNEKSGTYAAIKFRSKGAAEKAARARIELNRKMAAFPNGV